MLKIALGTYTASGSAPNLPTFDESERSILYWSGHPEVNIPSDILRALEAKTFRLRKMSSLGIACGTIELFALNKVAGVYYENMNVYDGCAEYVIASVRGQPLYSDRMLGTLALSDIRKREKGLYYPGYYLVLSNSLK